MSKRPHHFTKETFRKVVGEVKYNQVMRGAAERQFSAEEMKALIGEDSYGQLLRSAEVQPNPNVYPLPTIETSEPVQPSTAVVVHTPHFIEDGLFVEVTADQSLESLKEQLEQAGRLAKEKQRNEVLEKADSAYSYLAGADAFSYDSPVPTIAECKTKAAQMDLAMLESRIKNLNRQLAAYEGGEELGKKICKKLRDNITVSHGCSPTAFNNLFESEQVQIEEQASQAMKPLTEKFTAILKAVPYVKEILSVYVEALAALKTQRPSEKAVADAQKKLAKLAKNADEVIEKVRKVNDEVIHDCPTEKRIERATLLVQAYNAIEAEFKSVTQSFEPFNVHFDTDLKGLPILQNSIKKGLANPKRAEVLSKFGRR